MSIDNKKLYEFLKSKNFDYLYHANTVGTACTFLKMNGLLSRGAVEKRDLFQTYQKSDNEDKIFNVWNDIFLDVKDMHGYFPRQNLYGPVLFVYKTEVLLSENLPPIYITRDNPMYWYKDILEEHKYYNDLDEYIEEFENNVENHTIQSKMITLVDSDEPLYFNEYLERIILDNPRVKTGDYVYFVEAYKILMKQMLDSGLSKDLLEIRDSNLCTNCYCQKNYLGFQVSELNRLFTNVV